MELPRRKFLVGATALFCAPAIVRASSLMPVKARKLAQVAYEDFSTDNLLIKATERFSIGYCDPKALAEFVALIERDRIARLYKLFGA